MIKFAGKMQKRVLLSLLTALLFVACSETKYVPEGEYLMDKAKIVNDSKEKINTTLLRPYIVKVGNSRWFSAAKFPLMTYSMAGRDTTKWLNRTLRKIGEAPQLYDTLSTLQSQQNLQQQLQNMGYLRARVDVQNAVKKRKLTTYYHLHPGEPYQMRRIMYEVHDSAIGQLMREHDEYRQLRKGMTFNVDNLDAERKRITQFLTQNGYYKFNKDYITYRADSVPGTHEIDLTLVLHPYQTNEGQELRHPIYTIGKINYRSGNREDSIIPLRKKVLRSNTFIQEGTPYSSEDLEKTYHHFSRLGIVRYTNISFHERPDERILDTDIQLSTNKPSTISFQPEGTNTSGDFGVAAMLAYQNRNIFHGSENLSIELRGAYEAIKGLEGYGNGDFLEYSVEARLAFPRFIAPFLHQSFRRRINATSEVAVRYDLQNRPEFYRRVFSVAWRYKWHDQRHHDRYQFDLLDLNYISMPWISETFRREYLDNATSRNSILRYNYEDLFIMKAGFGYTYNNGRWAIKSNVETAGNFLSLLSRFITFRENELGQKKILNLAYAQYVRGNVEFTRNLSVTERGNSQLVFHVGLGVAYPYGNSTILPFEKRYFSGGANSVRGWSVRSLGPGRFVGHDGRIDFINQTGDMKLDMNIEYRARLFWKFGGALFVDAGNIWTIRDYEDQPGGQFHFDTFWKEIAVSYGLGLRLNFDYFIVRFDMGMKAINPAYENEKEHFPIVHPRLSRDFAFHFAVGLPF
jgi:outer membrane protein assembly factor BamA